MVSILCPDEVALLSFYSSSVPSGRIPALFFNFIFLFRDGVCPGSSVLGSSSGRLFAPSAGTVSSLSSPSVLPPSVTISSLVPSPCAFACKVREVCLVGLYRHFCFHGYHFYGISAGFEVGLVCVLVLGRQILAFVGEWGPFVPHQYLAGLLWASGRRQ